jgi:hypothetical protein
MISRRTIFSFLLTLLVGLCLRVWVLGQRDPCDSLAPGGQHPASVYVESGTRTVEMSCTTWFPRQPAWFLALCLVNMVIGVVFILSACGEWVSWREGKRW